MGNKRFGAKLKELRNRIGLTQKNVYEQLGISQSTFSSWETGKSEPDVMTFLQLCKIYKVDDILSEFTGKPLKEQSNNELSAIEQQLVSAYRNNPDMQPAINKMLDIDYKSEIHSEMKQMLKADKHKKQESDADAVFHTNSTDDDSAAFALQATTAKN